MIPLFKVYISPAVHKPVSDVLNSGYLTQGPQVEQFEYLLRKRLDVAHVLTLNSATSGLQLSATLAGLGPRTYAISTPQTCVSYNTRIQLADGSCEPIGKIVNKKLSVEVLTFNPDTKSFESGKILNWIKLPADEVSWYRLSYKNSGSNNQGKLKSIWITGDHEVLTVGGYKQVDQLTSRDFIATTYRKLNPTQEELVTGTLLGDGFIQAGGIKNLKGRLGIVHTEAQKEWLEIKAKNLRDFGPKIKYKGPYKHTKAIYRYQSFSSPQWKHLKLKWYPKGKKIIPKDIKLTPLVIATWYMDDGSRVPSRKGAVFCTDAFTKEENESLCEQLKNFKIEAYVGYRNRIYIKDATTLFILIAPYVPPCMRYKIKIINLDLKDFNENLWNFVASDVWYEIPVVEKAVPNRRHELTKHVYCLEIATHHNFIARNLVLKNCSATNTAILSTGANIIWADIDPHTGNITPEAIEYLLKKYHKQYAIKAVMCVDWGGNPCSYDEIFEITSKYGVKIIRDAAHAWGARYHNAFVPVNVDYTVYSFQAIKHLSCSDGGVLICQDHHDHALGKKLRWYGIDREAAVGDLRCNADIKIAGWKYHMNDLNATIGIHQMSDTDEIIAIHQRNGKYYNKRFLKSHPKYLNIPARYYNTKIHKSSYWIYTLLVTQPTQVMERLLDEGGIQTSRVHTRNDCYTMLKNSLKLIPLTGVDAFCAKQINIPCGWWVSEGDAETIADLTIEISETT